MQTRTWVALGIVVAFVLAIVITWNTAYGAGHADGVTQLACLERRGGDPTKC